MIHAPNAENRTILFGVTSSQSLKLLGKIPSAFAQIGWNVHVVAGDNTSGVPEGLGGVTIHILPMKRNPSLLSDINSLVGWIKLIDELEPNITVVGTPKASLLGMLASLYCRVPVRVYQLRGLRLETTSGPWRLLLFAVEFITAAAASSILAASTSLRAEYCRLGLSSRQKVATLGSGSTHGVDTRYFHPTRWSSWEPPEPLLRQAKRAELPILGFVGRFSKDKGAQEILDCSRKLLESGFQHSILVIGPIENEKEALVELKRLNQDTVITGTVADVAPYYSVMDLLLLPSHREGFPNVVLEAAASGIPAITTNATGAVDSVVDKKTGVIVPIGDGYEIARVVRELFANSQFLAEMRRNARDRAVKDFDSRIVTTNHVNYIMNCVTE